MNIREAKIQIKKTIEAYFSRDEFGNYRIEPHRQRPIFLIGPPGIGKTALMRQITSEMGIGLVSYSMTHHTRQSALGLPFIAKREFGGDSCHVTEYTMSEIVASVYKEIEKGQREGILFLDELNCVSETLTPAMLLFLQYKVFGVHQIPPGWLVVTAGNPPEYNSNAREFDPVTWDRLKRIDVEADLCAFLEYAREEDIHPAIVSFLTLHPENFYSLERTVDGDEFVTARSWEDLSVMLTLYEINGIDADEHLFGQYIQCRRIAEDFSLYFDLYRKYHSDYQIARILKGEENEEILKRAKSAPFDERITLSGMISKAVRDELSQIMDRDAALITLKDWIGSYREEGGRCAQDADKSSQDTAMYGAFRKEIEIKRERAKEAGAAAGSAAAKKKAKDELAAFADLDVDIRSEIRQGAGDPGFESFKAGFDRMISAQEERADAGRKYLECAMGFLHRAYDKGTELLMLLTDLTADAKSSAFLAEYGSEAYSAYSDELMVWKRERELLGELTEQDIHDRIKKCEYRI